MSDNISLAEKKKRLDKLSDGFNEKLGKPVIGRLSHNEALKDKLTVTFIKTPSLKVNEALGGGWAKGRISILAGNPDSGKTFHLLETIGENMKKNPEFVAGWLESEKSLSLNDLEMFGIDPERFFYLEITRKGAAEEALDAVDSALLTGTLDMFVINSLKCLVPKEELEKSMGSMQVGLQARLNGKMMRKLTATVAEQNVAFVMIQHLTTQIGGMIFGDPLTIGGGKSIIYGASVIADVRKLSIQETDPIKREEGVKIGLTVKKNHVITNKYPYVKTEYYGIFGQGTEKYLELIDIAVDNGIIVKAGSFYKVPDDNGDPQIVDGEKMQWQGTAKFRQYCIEHPEFFEDLVKKVEGNVTVEEMNSDEVEEIKAAEESFENDADLKLDDDVIEKANKKKKK